MAHAGQFGEFYTQVVDRFYHALEWRYNVVQSKPGMEREAEILANLLDHILADQVSHDLRLADLEGALRHFQKVRHDSFSPNKYKDILSLLAIDEKNTHGYLPQLFGHVTLDVHRIA